MIDPPQITQSEAQLTAMIHLTVPVEEMQNVMPVAIQELFAAVAAQGITPVGPLFAHHLSTPSDVFDFEISLPVAVPIASAGRVQPGKLAGTRVARTVYHGDYSGLASAWGEFIGWIDAEGYKTSVDFWECYAAGPESGPDPSTWRTELNKPLLG